MADAGGGRELLEPRLGPEGSREKLVRDLLTGKPAITAMGRSPLLDSVKDFLPKMAEAEVKLASTLSEEGGRDRLNVENLEEGQQVVEMDIALMRDKEEKKRGSWTSDSEADSTPSPSENSFTSDTDVSSSSSCSSSSSEDGDSKEKKESSKDTNNGDSAGQRKRPLIEELPSPPRAKTPRQS